MSPEAGVECTVSSECWLAGVMRWAAGGDGMGLPWRAKKSENHVCERCGLGGALWWGCNTMSCAVDDTPPTWGFPPHTCGVHQWYIPCSKDMYTYSIQCLGSSGVPMGGWEAPGRNGDENLKLRSEASIFEIWWYLIEYE